MLNKVMLIGRLGRDPELKYTQAGNAVSSVNIATDESYLDKNGDRVDKAEWHKIVLFNKQAENACEYLQKGSLVYIEGKLSTRKWQDKDGVDRYTTEILAAKVKYLSNWKGEKEKAKSTNVDYGQYENNSGIDDCPF